MMTIFRIYQTKTKRGKKTNLQENATNSKLRWLKVSENFIESIAQVTNSRFLFEKPFQFSLWQSYAYHWTQTVSFSRIFSAFFFRSLRSSSRTLTESGRSEALSSAHACFQSRNVTFYQHNCSLVIFGGGKGVSFNRKLSQRPENIGKLMCLSRVWKKKKWFNLI